MHLLTLRSSLQYLNDRHPLTPLIAAQLPDLFEHGATDEMPRLSPDQAHAFVQGNTARPVIARRLGHLHDATPKRLEPIVVDDHTGFADVAVFLPGRGEPEATVVTRLVIEADAADDLRWRGFQADHPVPFAASVHGRQCDISDVDECAVFGIGPWHAAVQVADNVPVREQLLNSGCVAKLQRREYQARGFEGRKAVHGAASVLEAVWPSGILTEQR